MAPSILARLAIIVTFASITVMYGLADGTRRMDRPIATAAKTAASAGPRGVAGPGSTFLVGNLGSDITSMTADLGTSNVVALPDPWSYMHSPVYA